MFYFNFLSLRFYNIIISLILQTINLQNYSLTVSFFAVVSFVAAFFSAVFASALVAVFVSALAVVFVSAFASVLASAFSAAVFIFVISTFVYGCLCP